MPLRILKHDIAILTKLRAIAYLIEFVQYVVEKHPNISREFVEYYDTKKDTKDASLQQEDNPTDEL